MVGDQTVDMAQQEVQAGGGAPVADQTMLDVLPSEGLLHQGVAAKINLSDGKIVGRSPILVDGLEGLLGDWGLQLRPRGADNRIRHVYSCTLVRLFIYFGYGLVRCHFMHPSGSYPMPTWYVNEQTFLNVFLQCVFALVRKCEGIVCLQTGVFAGVPIRAQWR